MFSLLFHVVAGNGNLTNTQSENCAEEEEWRQLASENVLEEQTTIAEEFPRYLQHLKVILDSAPREGSENSLRLSVECQNLESLELLWEDYRSGRLNAVADKFLVTDDIKTKFHVESVNLATVILEEDYLACKEFLLNNPSKLKKTLFRL